MKKFIYSQHDRVANFYNIIQVSDLDPEAFATNLKRSIMLCKDVSKLQQIDECETVCFGSYDDETGVFDLNNEPVVILDTSALAKRVISNYAKQ